MLFNARIVLCGVRRPNNSKVTRTITRDRRCRATYVPMLHHIVSSYQSCRYKDLYVAAAYRIGRTSFYAGNKGMGRPCPRMPRAKPTYGSQRISHARYIRRRTGAVVRDVVNGAALDSSLKVVPRCLLERGLKPSLAGAALKPFWNHYFRSPRRCQLA